MQDLLQINWTIYRYTIRLPNQLC